MPRQTRYSATGVPVGECFLCLVTWCFQALDDRRVAPGPGRDIDGSRLAAVAFIHLLADFACCFEVCGTQVEAVVVLVVPLD